MIVHTRDADDDTIAILRDEMAKGAFTGLIHCFTGTQRLADAALELGLYISVSGIATFKNSSALRDVIATVPLDRLLVETDAPYLAPVPHRGKTNEPAFVVHTAAMLAELERRDAGRTGRRHDGEFLPPVHQGAAARCLRSASWAAARPAACRALARAAPTGASAIPPIPKNRRSRCSILVTRKSAAGETRVLVDTSPDLREQLLAAGSAGWMAC